MAEASMAVELVAPSESVQVYPYTHSGGIPTPRFPTQALPTGGESHLHPSAQKPRAFEQMLPLPLRQSRRAGPQPLLDPSSYGKCIPIEHERVVGNVLKGDTGLAINFQTGEDVR